MLNRSDKKERILYLDILRIIAIIAVIFQHIVAFPWFNIHADYWGFLNFYSITPRFAVPVFIMISGALHLSAPDKGIKYFLNKTLKVFFVLFFWIIIYKITPLRIEIFRFEIKRNGI